MDASEIEEESKKIIILSTDDDKMKTIGELFSNESSKKILKLLLENESTANQIEQATGIRLSAISYHLQKMLDLDLVCISKIEKNSKNHDLKYYAANKFAIVILPSKLTHKAKESKLLLKSIKTIYRFSAISIAGIASWFITQYVQNFTQVYQKTSEQVNKVTSGATASEQLKNAGHLVQAKSNLFNIMGSDLFLPIIITTIVVIMGITMEILFRIRGVASNKF